MHFRMSLKLAVLLTFATILMLVASGCFRFSLSLKFAPTGAQDAIVEVLVPNLPTEEGQAQLEGKKDLDQILASGLWKKEEIHEADWQGVRLIGHAEPGQDLFPAEGDTAEMHDAVAKALSTKERLFTTEYHFAMTPMTFIKEKVAPPEQEEDLEGGPQGKKEEAGGQQPGGEGAGQKPRTEGGEKPRDKKTAAEPGAEGEPNLDLQFEGLDKLLMSAARFRLALALPGHVIDTNGAPEEEGVVWDLSLAELEEWRKEGRSFEVHTGLVHWQEVGRLLDAMQGLGRYDVHPEMLVDLIEAGVLPNPVVEDRTKVSLDPKLYSDLLTVVDALSDVAGGGVLAQALDVLGLGGDAPDAAKAATLATQIRAGDEAVFKTLRDAVAQALNAPRE